MILKKGTRNPCTSNQTVNNLHIQREWDNCAGTEAAAAFCPLLQFNLIVACSKHHSYLKTSSHCLWTAH